MTAAIASGMPKLRIEEAAAKRQARVDRGEETVVGVNRYRADVVEQVDVLDIDNTAVREAQIRRLGQVRGALVPLLCIGLAAGWTNLAYVLAVIEGEVMRVLLLFYLAPLWTVLLARLLLGEKVSLPGAAVIGLSLAGAVVMLWQPSLGLPLPENGAEWLGLAAGFLFAFANVLIRKAQELSIEVKSMAVFAGVVVVGLAVLPFEPGAVTLPPMAGWLLVALIGLVLLATNLFVQYGLTHTPANRAIVIFLFELLVAALASWLLAGEAMTLKEWLGGAMIVAASLFSGKLAAHETEPG